MTKHETPKPSQAAPGEITATPSGYRPWEDRSRPPEERFEAYKAHVQEQVLALGRAAEKLGTMEELRILKESPETQRLFADGEELSEMTAGEYCRRIDGGLQRELLGKNFLGAEEWRAQGIDVGEPPPIPFSVTEKLLDSDCPLHPGEKIKETHLLVLVPKTVNGEPYTALELDKLCATRKGSGERLISQWNDWKRYDWIQVAQSQSEWVLLPKRGPDPERMREKYGEVEGDRRHFGSKDLFAGQQEVHEKYYSEYREGTALEVMTMALLNDLVNGAPRILAGPIWLWCLGKPPGWHVCIGDFGNRGLAVGADGGNLSRNGRALARKL